MQVEVIITDDDGDVTTKKVELDRWVAMPPGLKLLSVAINRPLAETYLICVSAGMDVLIQEYGRANLEQRKAEFRTFIEGE